MSEVCEHVCEEYDTCHAERLRWSREGEADLYFMEILLITHL